MTRIAFHGNYVWTSSPERFQTYEDAYLLCDEEGVILGIQRERPAQGAADRIVELGDGFVMPAYTDLHLHSSQLAMTGLGCDGTGDQWFLEYCHPTEKAYGDPETYQRVNAELVRELERYGTMHANIMSTVSLPATVDLAERLEQSDITAFVGKMNSDYSEAGEPNESTEASLRETEELIERFRQYRNVRYTISPEFIPACSGALLAALGELAVKYDLPVHSHINEGPGDTADVARRYPVDKTYAQVLRRHHLFGDTRTVMAHATYAELESLRMMASLGVFLAYCPFAVSHIPNERFLDVNACMEMGIPVGLGSDIGGGHTLDMRQVIVGALLVSKVSGRTSHLTLPKAFYLATKGGGSYFGKVGSLEPGYQFDALVIDDAYLRQFRHYTLQERIERYLYCGSAEDIKVRIHKGSMKEMVTART